MVFKLNGLNPEHLCTKCEYYTTVLLYYIKRVLYYYLYDKDNNNFK